MRNKKWIWALVLAGVLLFGAGMAAGAAGTEPGSNGDPLITKSYLDSRISSVASQTAYQEVTLSKGKRLVCVEGTQIVLISGKAKATAAMTDLTAGSRTGKNKAVQSQHSYLVTKENSGIKASQSSTVYVAGEYSIQ